LSYSILSHLLHHPHPRPSSLRPTHPS
jgi:hypothetical protein